MRQDVNRAEQLWKNWEEKQKRLESLAGLGSESNSMIGKLKYDFLRQGLYRLSVNPSEKEQLYLHVIRSVTARLEKQLYPNPVIRTLHRLKVLLHDRPAHLKMFERQKAENMEQLTTQLKTSGFASFTGKLDNYLDYERAQISIPMTTQLADKGTMDIILKLERDRTGHYRFTEYQAGLYRDGSMQCSYTFPAEGKVTAIEAANLLEGRPVSKSYRTANGSIAQKWVQLDFRENGSKLIEFHAGYGYDLKKEIMAVASGLGVDGLGRDKIIRDLEAGKLIAMEVPDKGRYYLHANPADRSVSVLDAGKRPVALSELLKEVKEGKAAAIRSEVKLHKVQENHRAQDQPLSVGI
ncbi:hypothetical protein GCM10022216_02350 [Sphingobacterium kyonggiense]|uniref:Uncharacterized protein n=1 Tax=Sphingobacterium kyonggiense TaxID=714075 RepID=A0ABP7Y7S7_9SPHI